MIDTQNRPDAAMDQEKSKLIRQLLSWWNEVRDYDDENRREMATDEDFVDGDQYTEEEKLILESRGQLPLVYNEIRLAVAWLTGTEKKTRVDWSVLPREENDEEGAQTKTEILKYLNDVNRFPFERSAAFEEAVRAGRGWLEVGIRGDGEEPICVVAESWRNVWCDPMSRKPDLSDARFLMRSKVMDLDIAQSMFPEHKERLQWEADHFEQLTWQNRDIELNDQHHRWHISIFPGDVDHDRPVVRIIECWYRSIEKAPVLQGAFFGQVFDERVMAHRRAVADGRARILSDKPRMIMKLALFTLGGYLLAEDRSPYIHNRFPFVPLYGLRRARDGAPYGVPRQARDAQIDLNKRRSKALFALSTNKVIADEDAVADPELFEREAARPDQVVWKKPGREIVFLNNFQLADAHVNLALQDSEFIRQTSGVTGENLGLDTNAISGKAIIAKQQQGSVTSAGFFDNLRLATQLTGELLLSLVEQFWDQDRSVRVTGRKGAEFIPVNRMLPDGSVMNDITARQADFKVSEHDFTESYRQAMFETTLEIVGRQPPELAIKLLDLVFEFSDLPNKEEIVKRIRAINGQHDPDDPQAQAAAEQAAAEQAQQAQQQQMLEMDKMASEAELRRAQAQNALADAEHARASAEKAIADAEKARADVLFGGIKAMAPPIQSPQPRSAANQPKESTTWTP